ncbi:MAG: TAXI family TRAP transporter solute-binding subunit [Pseudomonadota bacterium]
MFRRVAEIVIWVLGSGLMVGGVAALAFVFLQRTLMPPDALTMAAGRSGGGYHNIAMQYKAVLARDNIRLEILETAGSVENAQALSDGTADIALLQGGIRVSGSTPIEAIAAVFLEPFFILHRRALPAADDPTEWVALRVAAGEPGSGTRAAVLAMAQGLGVAINRETLLPLGGQAAADALLANEVDVAVFVAPVSAPYLQDVLRNPQISIGTVRDSTALARSLPYIQIVDIPRSGIDYAAHLPPRRIELTAMVATMVGRADLHPALVNRIVRAAERIHSGPNPLSDTVRFPSTDGIDIPVNDLAAEALRTGPTRLEAVLPYWMSAQIRQVALIFVPLLLLLYPLLRAFPGLFAWHMRTRVYRHYRALLAVEAALQSEELSAAETRKLARQLESIDQAITRLNVPLRYREYAYSLRLHVDLVRRRLTDLLGPRS